MIAKGVAVAAATRTDSARRERPSICFVAPNIYPLLSDRCDLGHIGGAETQLCLIARGLVARGYRVSVVAWDHGQPDGVEHDGMRVFKTCRTDAGVRVLRFIHPRATALWYAMGRAATDLYVQRTADSDTGLVAAWCHWHRRRFIFCTASDADCLKNLPWLHTRRERVLYRYGLRRADRVVAQTLRQVESLREQFGLSSCHIPSCSANRVAKDRTPDDLPPPGSPPRVLWVGRISREKRLEWLLDAADRCADMAFDVVGATASESHYESALLQRAARTANVAMHGQIPHSRVMRFYHRATLLCCTSAFEGFPNTFLEAWSVGLPVVSTVDPDALVTKRGLGVVAGDVAGLVRGMRELVDHPALRRRISTNARKYYLHNHTPEVVIPRFEKLLLEVCSPDGGFRSWRRRAMLTS